MERMSERIGRRRFLSTGAAAAAAVWAPAVLGRAGERIRTGCIGLGSRGTYLLGLFVGFPDVEVVGVCDLIEGNVRRARDAVERVTGRAPDGYGEKGPLDYRRLLARNDLDAVVIATPVSAHAAMAVDGLRAGKAVLSEVVAADTLEDAWALVGAAAETGRPYMMAENVCYFRENMAVSRMVEEGLFGPGFTYGECGYVHDCRSLIFAPDGSFTWRGEMVRDRIGNRYPTHSLGPLARWMGIGKSDRFVSLVATTTRSFGAAEAARRRFGPESPQGRTEFKGGDSTTVLIRTEKGAVIDLRYDIASPRPCRSTVYLELQGEKGCYRSREGEIWLESKSPSSEWEPFGKYAREFDHPMWAKWEKDAAGAAHGGADFLVLRDFFDALGAGKKPPIDAADAVAWSAVIPLSEESIRKGGAPVAFPDFRKARA